MNGISVHKFGGTSLGNPKCYQGVADILEQQQGKVVVVVSAMAGMTDTLLNLCQQAAGRDPAYLETIGAIHTRQRELLESIGAGDAAQPLLEALSADIQDITELMRGSWLLHQATPAMQELISGYGERWSARALGLLLQTRGHQADWVEANRFLVVEDSHRGKAVDWEATRRLFAEVVPEIPNYLVVTGFIARDPEGKCTTLGRNGSDYSAAIMASLVKADQLTIWTDVDGVLSADPRRVPEARVLGSMSYDEAFELAYFGAKVIHPQTMGSVIREKIPVYIRNTFRPQLPGTRISMEGGGKQRMVKGLSTIDKLAIINIEGTGMIGVPGIDEKIFRTLNQAGISVVMVSQASSEHSICLAIQEQDAGRAQRILKQEFTPELNAGQVHSIRCESGISILALVGDAMAGSPGVAGRFLSALGQAGVNIRAIAQGSSERNISVAIHSEQTTRALRAAHSAFYLSSQTYSVGIIGTGTVGGVLIDQITRQARELKEKHGIDLRVRAICTSRKMLLADHLETDRNWRETFEREAVELDMEAFEKHVRAEHLPHHVLVDCTSSQQVADRYLHWLDVGVHLVTPNKKANSGPQAYYQALQQKVRDKGVRFLYETNVGAGLPIIQTLQELVHTGDRVHRISGIFSGTMAYLFNKYDGSTPFSQLVAEARAAGYTEPDPRDDLSGMDVARKLLILAREMGLNMELADIEVESLVPPGLEQGGVDEFMQAFAGHDQAMMQRLEQARTAGRVLRYIGEVDDQGRARVVLAEVEPDSALATIQLTDNIVEFNTERYCDNPLVVRGPGAGPEVTAGGVFADLLRVCRSLGARL